VLAVVRDTAKGEQAAARLAGRGSTSVVGLDLSDLDLVAGCAETLLERHENLSALICNAGVMGGPSLLSAQGFERQIATNHLGHAALVAALWPLLHASAAHVVLVSSTEARGGKLSPQTTREQLLNPSP
jgi:NAD(P)-dependent dehydrogenase (short-subunit alcohol dehydrogenase family)